MCVPAPFTSSEASETYSLSAIASGLFRSDVKAAFLRDLEKIYDCWVPILRRATLPAGIPYTDNRVQEALKALDMYIVDARHTSRLGSIQLTRFLSALQRNIKSDRFISRAFPAKKSRSVVIDTYVKSRGSTEKTSRYRALQSVRMASRWNDLAGGCPLLVIFLTDKAERIVCV